MPNKKLKALAIALEVSGRDLHCLITSVYNEMMGDGIAEHYCLTATEEERGEIISAYISHSNIKFRDFAISYLANDEKKEAFNALVKGL